MELITNWRSLDTKIHFIDTNVLVPDSQLTDILLKYSTKREIASKCASYYVHYHPQPSWTQLAKYLYQKGEFAAVEKLKPLLPLRGKC